MYCIALSSQSQLYLEKRGKVSSNIFFGGFLFCLGFLMKPFYNMTLEDLGDTSRLVKLINGSL